MTKELLVPKTVQGWIAKVQRIDNLMKEAKLKNKAVVWTPRGRHGVAPNGIVYVSVGRFSFGKDESC